ncbi:hypothetical protein [Candidatus Nitrosacidococcus tergens]|uniref:Uncharacterized protein n=1 Tax=Candidatus Nitrosacidococcus tergens TaxID=553981 RepID=A0A7G1Q919_9GAMM|nr:hypothetical protein [Candidatus Nitrosacidococcus tergens]CAB1275455.1 protein of unknown function [Candidatus Nitrosacidococcus tergens]
MNKQQQKELDTINLELKHPDNMTLTGYIRRLPAEKAIRKALVIAYGKKDAKYLSKIILNGHIAMHEITTKEKELLKFRDKYHLT